MTLFECPCCGQPMPEQPRTSFSAFWADVPHKIARAVAEKAWKRLTPGDRNAAHERVKHFYSKWRDQNKDASPIHPATYLNQRRWEDYPPPASVDQDEIIANMLASPTPAVREQAAKMLERQANGI